MTRITRLAPRVFFFKEPATTEIYTLSLHDALPISARWRPRRTSSSGDRASRTAARRRRSEEHTSELQSRFDLVCRLLLEKKKRSRRSRQRTRRRRWASPPSDGIGPCSRQSGWSETW